jgi:hypothetical protein
LELSDDGIDFLTHSSKTTFYNINI